MSELSEITLNFLKSGRGSLAGFSLAPPAVRVLSIKEFSKDSFITKKTKVDCDISDGFYTLVDHINDV